MTKQTIQLFIKALVIGVLLNVSLEQVPHTISPVNDSAVTTPHSQQAPATQELNMFVSNPH